MRGVSLSLSKAIRIGDSHAGDNVIFVADWWQTYYVGRHQHLCNHRNLVKIKTGLNDQVLRFWLARQ